MASGNGFQAKKILLTYSQLPIEAGSKYDLYEWFQKKYEPAFLKVAEETHKEGGRHWHLVARWSEKKHVRGMDGFDYKGIHPNWQVIKKGKSHWTRTLIYLEKEDPAPVESEKLTLFDPFKFEQQRANFQAYKAALYKATLQKPIFPMDLELIGLPVIPAGKRRHLWLWGPSDIGKSTWFRERFCLAEYFLRPKKDQHPFDAYDNEAIICYDDVDMERVGWDELCALCDKHRPYSEQYPGTTRYANKFLSDQERLVIVLSNYPPPTRIGESAAFRARFQVFKVTRLTFNNFCRVDATAHRTHERDDEPEGGCAPVIVPETQYDATESVSAVAGFRF